MTRYLRSIYRFTTSTKENKVIPTEHTARPTVTPKTRRFATLRDLLQAQGSGAPARSLVPAPLAALCAFVALCVTPALGAGIAQAAPPKLVSYGKVASEGPGVTVDQASGDVFTAGFFDIEYKITSKEQEESVIKSFGHIEKLDAEGKPLSTFGHEGLYAGAVVNPVSGNLYVLEALNFETGAQGIAVYEPSTGELIRSFPVSSYRDVFDGFYSILQIASDSSGNVYVPGENDILEYSEAGTLLKTFTGSGAGALKEPTGVAIDSFGNLWVADSGDGRIVELDSSGAPVEVNGKPVEIESEGVFSLAPDGHGNVFATVDNSADSCGANSASSCVHLVEYSPEGRQLADVGAGYFGVPDGTTVRFSIMVAADEASGRVYVTDMAKHTVWMFGPPIASVVDRELTAEIGASEVKLGAFVNPGGLATTYRFEYGSTSAYGSSAPFPEGSAGEGVHTQRAVWTSASGLAPGRTYHYRVVLTNELGTVYGPDQTFTTLTAEQAACPNEEFRGGFSARLPDCRAYELVTPPVKSSVQFDAQEKYAYASTAAADGEAITLATTEPYPGAPTGGYFYVGMRGADGWIEEDIVPLESYDGIICQELNYLDASSDQLTKDVIQTGEGSRASSRVGVENPEACNTDGRQVVGGEPVGYANLLVRDNATGAYQLVNVTPPGVRPADAGFQAASADLSRVFFTETSPLAEGAQYGVNNLYEWDEGVVHLATVLPSGTPVCGYVCG